MNAMPRILVVEDDLAIQTTLELVLSEEGYEVVSVGSGADALARIPEFEPRLIILDLRMPVMDGSTFVHTYRQQPGGSTPIIVITASQNPQAAAAELQVSAVLAKPFNLDELLTLVKEHVAAHDAV